VGVVGRVLPVSTAEAPGAIRAAIDAVAPRFVLMLGVWPGRSAFSIERVAINVRDFPYEDNDGAQPIDETVVPRAHAAYLSSIPIRPVIRAWADHDLPGTVSSSAGTYLCNQTFYVALHHTAGSGPPVGFVHLPNLPSESARRAPPDPSLPLATLVDGVRVAIEALTLVLLRGDGKHLTVASHHPDIPTIPRQERP